MNLESEIYRLSFELSKELEESDLNKILGVLSSDGVYAMWVYAMDKFKKDQQKMNKINDVIEKLNSFVNYSYKGDVNNNSQDLAQDLNKLLFMKELLERVLIYARYHAMAKGDEK